MLGSPDRAGKNANITLGFPSLDGYLQRHPFFGSTVGRYGNRIAGGKFTLDGKSYTLATNNGPNHLHGGQKGFDAVMWKAEPVKSEDSVGVKFSYTSADDGYAVLAVEDDGPGVPEDIEQRVFERFVRAGRGSGLGLSIVRAVAESHGGTVTMERPANRTGTRVVIRIPLERSIAADRASGNGAQTSTTTGSTIGRRRRRS